MADIGRVRLKATGRSTISSQNFEVTPNVSIDQVNGVSTTGVQNGYTLVYNSTTNKFEAKENIATDVELANIIGGSF
jgi:hypothetical protein